jgi:hypothetical protein
MASSVQFFRFLLKKRKLFDIILVTMMRHFKFIFFSLATVTAGLESAPLDYFQSQSNQPTKLVIHNRPLLKIHGKTISVMDVKKKMDIFLHENHPEAVDNPLLAHQFYSQSWRSTLQEMINTELVLMESEELKYEIPEGDINQEIESRFGPNVVQRLDKMNLSLEEAKIVVRDDIISKNMSWYRVWARVHQLVSPDIIKKQYEHYLATADREDSWKYQTLTVRGNDRDATLAISEQVHEYLQEHPYSPFSDVAKTLNKTLPSSVSLNVSAEFEQRSNQLSPEYLAILSRLPLANFSEPIEQKSKSDGNTVFRFFQVKRHEKVALKSLDELVPAIRGKLLQEYGQRQMDEYFGKLRKRFCCEDLVVDTLFDRAYQPFSIY